MGERKVCEKTEMVRGKGSRRELNIQQLCPDLLTVRSCSECSMRGGQETTGKKRRSRERENKCMYVQMLFMCACAQECK